MNIKFKEFGKKASGKIKILVDMSIVPHRSSITFRKKALELLKDTFKDPGYEKIAFFGASIISKTVVSFIITASRFKNIKQFKTEEEAIKWLKGN